MITAKEAYDIARPRLDEYLGFLEKKIEEAARKGKLEVLIRDTPYATWMYNKEALPADAKIALQTLSDNGFSFRQYQDDGSQFSDIALKISWEHAAS